MPEPYKDWEKYLYKNPDQEVSFLRGAFVGAGTHVVMTGANMIAPGTGFIASLVALYILQRKAHLETIKEGHYEQTKGAFYKGFVGALVASLMIVLTFGGAPEEEKSASLSSESEYSETVIRAPALNRNS